GPHVPGGAAVSASDEAAPAVSAADGATAASETGSGVRSFYAAAPVHGADGVMEGVEVPEANAVSGGAPDRTFGAPEPSDAEPGGAAVPIAELIFRGSSALHEALSLRPRIEAAARDGSSASLDALITELFDLVELGIEADHPYGAYPQYRGRSTSQPRSPLEGAERCLSRGGAAADPLG